MRTGYALVAVALGLIGFGAVEIASRERGVLAALTPYLWLDAVVLGLPYIIARSRKIRMYSRRSKVPPWPIQSSS